MQIFGFNKTTLLDYPEHVACTVFTGGCNFRCPFCQNGGLVEGLYVTGDFASGLAAEGKMDYNKSTGLHARRSVLNAVSYHGDRRAEAGFAHLQGV